VRAPTLRPACLLALTLVACDGGASEAGPTAADATADAARNDGDAVDAALLDAAADSAVASDAADAATPASDAATDAAPVPDTGPGTACARFESPRPDDALRVEGCRLVRGAEGLTAPPRGAVVSGDSLQRAARTPRHEAPQYVDLARGGLDLVWLLVTWDGIEPVAETINGAYTARICQQAGWAGDAGLDVVLAMHFDGWGPALGGHGAPEWATPAALDGPDDADAAWAAFFEADARRGQLLDAWIRLLDTCAETGSPITGIAPIHGGPGHPAREALSEDIVAAARTRLGPVLAFLDPGQGGALPPADGWGEILAPRVGRSPAGPLESTRQAADRSGRPLFLAGLGGADADSMAGALAAAESVGAGWAVWHDGFDTGDGALRDEDGAPGPLWEVPTDRPWPEAVAGSIEAFGSEADATWVITFSPTDINAGVSTIDLGPLAPDLDHNVEVSVSPEDAVDWVADADPATGRLTLFVGASAAPIRATVRRQVRGGGE
jgi:hypothetical protein